MIDSKYRGKYQTIVADQLLKLPFLQKIHPHLFTLMGCLSGFAVLILLFFKKEALAFVCLVFSGLFDTLDGSQARLLSKHSNQGAVLDIASDRFVEFCVVLGLFFISPDRRGLPCILMMGSILFCVTTFLVVGIFSRNEGEKSFHYSIGIMERTEAFAFFGLMILVPAAFFPLSYLFSILVFLTGILRTKDFISNFS